MGKSNNQYNVRIGIVGSRQRNTEDDCRKIEKILTMIYDPGTIIVSGGCPKGGDRFAEELAKKLGLSIIIYRAEWDKFGKGAGFIRNTEIAENCDILIACVASDRTGGTEDTIRKVEKLGKKVYLV